MLTVYNCIMNAHDWRLVCLAAVICTLASFTAISLLHHVRRSSGHMRLIWLAVSATSTGSGIWATHFIAMLAFSPGLPTAYNIALTVFSLIAAIFLTGMGLAVAVMGSLRAAAWLGGAMVGGGIAAMHYTGMAAFEIQGRIVWDPTLVLTSIALGSLIGALALPVGLRGDGLKWKVLGALLLTVAICSHHFTAMGAASIVPDPTIEFSATALPSGWLAIAVALASFTHRPGARRRSDRDAGSATGGARVRSHAGPRQRRLRGAAGLRRRRHRYGQRQLCTSDRIAGGIRLPVRSWSNAFPTKARA